MRKWGLILLTLILLSGCWDERLVKDINLIYSQALDKTDEELIETTIVTIGGAPNESGAQTASSQEPAIISAVGNTPRDSRMNLDRKVSGELYASKNRVTLLSQALAEENIYSLLDVHYRSPLSTTNARIAVVKGDAKRALYVKTAETPLISDYLGDLLVGSEAVDAIPKASMENVLSALFDNGIDFVLPLLHTIDHENVALEGLALFDNDHMTGQMNADQTLRLMLMDRERLKPQRLNIRVTDNEENRVHNYVTVDVEEKNRELTVTKEASKQFKAHIDVALTLNVVEYPRDTLYIEEHVTKLNDEINNKLQKESEEVLRIIQEANCDYYGIGKQIRAFYYDDWQGMNWEEAYSTTPLTVTINTEVIYHGIVN
ncbi:Ger(x)C family spore germination protein [Shouchella sp. JSM 1781072]|uniref:Ger(x)C family spore germination protein n=1 Tax=Bacillaceae TaxID=186817 RepID=UPI000C0814B3|nr:MULTISPECIES: Ger(x)C family spore germination protein [Bacillaceae]UTR06933.1 Ger(x)C family spore germination protein [Alkalihalobacillus sp. LMS6]